MIRRLAAAAALAALAGGCVPQQQAASLQTVQFDDIPGWSADSVEQTLPALQAECRRLALLPADTELGGDGIAALAAGKAGQWSGACTAALALAPGDAAGIRHFYETWFAAYRIDAPGLFTGYYEPEVRGALTQGGAFQTPLLGRPADLQQDPPPANDPKGQPVFGRMIDGKLVPYWTRAEIENGRIGSAAHPLLWLADPADLLFLQIQGSGRVRLPDGSLVRVGYDGKNGRPYTPIGRVLVEQGALAASDVTMQSIHAWLDAHPTAARAVMDRNENYVFFRILTSADSSLGPPGALGVDLLAGRSAAVDRRTVPLGVPVFVETTDPVTGALWRRLLLAQDLGTDIKGAARTDIFLGAGPDAEQRAGKMRQPGTEYLLLPRPPA